VLGASKWLTSITKSSVLGLLVMSSSLRANEYKEINDQAPFFFCGFIEDIV
jgi:hypothetical protein